MISKIIAWCARNPFLVFSSSICLAIAGVWCFQHIPLDALPDISDVQVVIHTSWAGEPPSVIEDQVTYPIVTALLSAPRVNSVRAQTMFGDSYVFVVFKDGTDLYWARSRVVEYLQQIAGKLPAGVHPAIGPDATGAGWVYEYAILDRTHTHNLADLRALQDWYLRYQLETVPGVAEVASIGGFVRQYQVNLDPNKLFSYGISAATVIERVRQSSNEVGGDVLEANGAEYMIRGLGYIRSLSDLENIPVATRDGTPVLIKDLGTVTFGADVRRGAADWQGEGETVGGIVVMRFGMNALRVIDAVKARLRELAPSLPPGVEIVTAYDRSGLINQSIHTLRRDLLLEGIIVSLVCIVFLFHFRSALVPILTLPIAVLAAFIPMYFLHVSSNIMSLGGLALGIGVLIDASIVIVENGHRHLAELTFIPSGEERRLILVRAAQQVGPALFFSLMIIVVSFLPVFLLEAQEGRMFRPLAWTKTLALICSSLLSITLAPALMPFCLRGKLRPEAKNPISRLTQALYLPVLRWCLRHWKLVIALNLAFLGATIPLYFHLGSQFMPTFYEGSLLYMPSALPGISITQATALMQEQDRILRSFPEVATVFGTVGRSDSATDNAPLDMFDTTIMLKPRSRWRPGITYQTLIQQMDAKLQFPGLTNTWTMPVQNRLDMEMTGIKTPLGIKIQGPNLNQIEEIGAQMQQILSELPETDSVFAERVSQGFYLNIDVNRLQAARYGLTVGDVQQWISSEIGGADIAETIAGRQRFPIAVRYLRDFRDDPQSIERALLPTPVGAQIPLSEVARVFFSRGPSMIRDEDGLLTGYVYLNLKNSEYGGFVKRAQKLLNEKLLLPTGYTWRWAGEYQFEQRARHRLTVILPIVFFVIFVLLYLVFRSAVEAAVLLFPTLFAMSGGLMLQWMLGYHFSVAVWVGYIALFGIAVETGVVMVLYLDEAWQGLLQQGKPITEAALQKAILEGAVQRLRPKLMTVTAVVLSLAPILWESGIGSDVMKPIATPIVGGMITSTIHVLILVPVFFLLIRRRFLERASTVANTVETNP
ncbi:MAG: efflux RND transporter permease subunit [Acidobacteriaceae bacterium]